MSNNKYYYYNHEEGIFVEASLPRNNHKRNVILAVSSTLLLSFFAFWIFSLWGGTQKENVLSSENKVLREELSQTETRMDNLFSKLDELYKKDNTLYRVMLQSEPIDEEVREVGIGGSSTEKDFSKFSKASQQVLGNTLGLLDKLERQINLQNVSYQELLRKAKNQRHLLRSKPAIMPAEGKITSGYGPRRHPILGIMTKHDGIDIVLPVGSSVYATADGEVETAEVKGGYGRTVVLKHSRSGYKTIYAHLSAFQVSAGQKVKRGDLIAKSGNSGMSTGPHLHYEVANLDGSIKYDPMLYIISSFSPKQYRKILENTEHSHSALDYATVKQD